MKVLLINPEKPAAFWTLRETCRFAGRRTMVPPLGLITVAALLPRGWELRLVDLEARPLTAAHWDWAELVMLSGMLVQRQGLLSLIQEAKARGKTVVVGGPYPTSLPEEVLEAGSDFVIRGEAENTLPLFLAALAEGKSKAVFENERKPELSSSPVPRFDLLNLEDYVIMAIQTSRGCPFDCEFCDVVNLYGRKPRYKEPQQVLGELTELYRLGWRREVFICDDNFIGHKTHAAKILQQLIPWLESHGYPFSFWTQTSVNLGHDQEMIDLMTEANFSNVFIGIESPDEDVLASAGKHQNIRHPLAETLNTIRDNGLTVVGSFIIGFDGEKPGVGERIASLVEATCIPMVMINVLQPLPGTRFWYRLQREGRLVENHGADDPLGITLHHRPTRPVSQILADYCRLWDYLHEPSHFLARAYGYFLAMRPTRRALAQRQGLPLPAGLAVAREPLGRRMREFLRFLRLSWRQGMRSPCRWQYWRQLLDIKRKNPSRWVKYINVCALGEDMFRVREEIIHRLAGNNLISKARAGRTRQSRGN